MKQLPLSWTLACLEEFAEVILGQSPPGDSYNEDGIGLPFFQGKAEFGDLRPTIRKWTTEPRRIALENDVLLSVRAPVGPTNLAPGECVVGRGLAALRPLGAVDPRYILYGMRATVDSLASKATGTTFGAVNGAQVRSHRLPLAPLNEQRRIVEAIEEQLSRLDAAKGTLESASIRLALLRRLVLDEVTRLDGDVVLAGKVTEVQGGIQKQPKRRPLENHFPFLRVANVRRGELDLSDVHEVELFAGELERLELRTGDLLVVEGNGSAEQIGRCAMWRGEIANCVHQNHLIRVRPGERLDPNYLSLYWNAPSTSKRIAAVASSTSGLYTLSTRKVKAVELLVPPLITQQQTVADVERRLSLIEDMQRAIETAGGRSAALRQSILDQAFRGELVSQDASDEPASALLERLAAERPRARSTQRRKTTA